MTITRKANKLLPATLAALLGLPATAALAAPDLGTYTVDTDKISISGLSSGGFMAVQMHVAYSELFMGVGSVAGGVYNCAEGNQMNATGRCMDDASAAPPSAAHFKEIADSLAAAGKIDPTSGMAGDKVWIFTGGRDSVVRTESSDRARTFYEYYTSPGNVYYSRNEIQAQHAMPTKDYGDACGFLGSAYSSPPAQWINNCNYDAAGLMLQHFYGNLNPRTSQVSANLKTFNQSPFYTNSSGLPMNYIDTDGYIYVPTACQNGATCKLHVALHGCLQNRSKVGDKFARNAGYNQWAESNNIIVVYPQTSSTATNGCWDWWGYGDGYSGPKKYHTKDGDQMKFVKAVIDRVTGNNDDDDDDDDDGAGCFVSTNAAHGSAGRATVLAGSYYYAKGSWAFMGSSGSTVTKLRQTGPGNYVIDNNCSG